LAGIREKRELTNEIKELLNSTFKEFKQQFKTTQASDKK
jgi:hypothetical protein